MGPSPKMVLRSRLWYCRRTVDFMALQDEPTKEDMTKMWPNKSLQATRDGRSSSASRFTLVSPACLSFCR